MSTITTANLKLYLKEDTPDDIRNWLLANNTKGYLDSADYEKIIPKYIREEASRCATPGYANHDDSGHYNFRIEDGVYIVELLYSHKDKDYDFEKFINYMMPFINDKKSLGFIHDDYGDVVYKINLSYDKKIEDMSILDLTPIPNKEEHTDGFYSNIAYVEIDSDIDMLEDTYKERVLLNKKELTNVH